MKIKESIFGFTLISTEEIAEISAYLHIFEHKKSGAKLAFIDREDTNLSFAIGFKTPPSDSTGVFHIIEHSVLCGSRKFPTKEPFVEMLKGSLNTFLNAMTYEDKTVYPVASRCERDFHNLVDVYLDAVFHPLMLDDENIFMQEGHHLEYDKESDTLSRSGVVFNEMQGVYSSPDELSGALMSKILFKGSIYEHDAGGAPDAISHLTYEDFRRAHKKYYRPDNAYIVLDGSIDLNKTLPLIDSYLSEYDRSDFLADTEYPGSKICPMQTLYYEADDETEGKGKLLFSTVFGRISEQKKSFAISLLMDVLAGSNEAPLKKRLLASGLVEDVSLYANKTSVNTITLELHGVREDDTDALCRLVKETVSDIIACGIEKGQLEATLNRLKFRTRERDFGSFPKGVAFALSVMEVWLYGVEPSAALAAEETLKFLEEKIRTDYFESLLYDATLGSNHRATLLMLPRIGESEVSKRISEELALLRKTMSKEDIEAVILKDNALKLRQSTPDSEAVLKKIPALSPSDIEEKSGAVKTEIFKIGNAEILRHNTEISGILYTELYFYAENLTKEELTGLSILAALFTNLDTENYSAGEIKEQIKCSLGNFAPNALAYTDTKILGRAIPLFTLSASALSENADRLVDIIREVLLFTKFDDKEKIKKILTQIRSATEDTVLASGDGITVERVEAALTEAGCANEEIMGLTAYKRIKKIEKNFDEECDSLITMLRGLIFKLFTKSRLTISISGDTREGLAEDIAALFADGDTETSGTVLSCTDCKEAVILPIRISHTAMGFVSSEAAELLGALKVARSILSYEYLWNSVRVIGGAYGAGLVARRHGTVMLYSYRDPSPARTLEVFRGAGEFLEKFLEDTPDLTKYIIGAYGDYDILTTPRSAARQKSVDHITKWSEDDEKKLRHDILNTDKASLLKVAALLKSLDGASYTVVCGKDMLKALGNIDTVTP